MQALPFVPRVLGFQAIRGSGKDTAFAILSDMTPITRLAFADKLYDEVSAAFGCTPADLQHRDTKETPQARFACQQCSNDEFVEVFLRLHPDHTPATPQSPRHILQYWGSEYRRNLYGSSYWTDPILQQIRSSPFQRFVVTDTRFPNEAGLISGVPPEMHYKFPLEQTLSTEVLKGLPDGAMVRIIRPDLLEQYLALPPNKQHASETSLLNWPVHPSLTWVNPFNQQDHFRAQIKKIAALLNQHPLS